MEGRRAVGWVGQGGGASSGAARELRELKEPGWSWGEWRGAGEALLGRGLAGGRGRGWEAMFPTSGSKESSA